MSALDGVADEDLVVRLVSHDPAALDELFRRHRRRVISYALRRCSQPADVADLVSATFLALMESAASFDPSRGSVPSWLVGIAHRQLGLLRRGEAKQARLGQRAATRRALDDDTYARVEEAIDATQESIQVEHALAGLSEQYREALWLVGHDGLAPTEAAAALQVSAAVFRVRLQRARRALRAALGDAVPPVHSPLLQEVHP